MRLMVRNRQINQTLRYNQLFEWSFTGHLTEER